jgi:hypothetical protein
MVVFKVAINSRRTTWSKIKTESLMAGVPCKKDDEVHVTGYEGNVNVLHKQLETLRLRPRLTTSLLKVLKMKQVKRKKNESLNYGYDQ